MRYKYTLPALILASAALGACSMEPKKNVTLEEARSGYSAAQSNANVNKHAAIELQQAGKALDEANAAQKKREDSKVVDHLAYLAKQKVAIAQETAGLKAAEIEVTNSAASRDQVRLDVRTAEADAAKRKTVTAQQAAMSSEAELAVANARVGQMNAMVGQMEAELAALNAKQTERGLVITLGDVLFDTNKAELRSRGTDGMQKLADFFKEYPQRTALIEGFTDSTGDSSYNQDLSERRANAVRNSLLSMGVSGDRVSTSGLGEANPVASNTTTAGRQSNRRVEIILSDENGSVAPR